MIAAASFLIAIIGAWLWTSFAAPPITRSLGMPMVSGWRLDRHNRHMSKRGYVWGCGVFAVGSGLFLFITLRQCLYCELLTKRLPHLSGPTLAIRLIVCLAGGWLFGVLTAPQHEMSDFPFR